MALTWEPRWEPIVVEYAGMRIRTCRDKVTGMIACPICINAVKECIEIGEEEDKSRKNISKKSKKDIEYTFFFSERDLFIHIKHHREKPWLKERKEVKTITSTVEE